ncbi:MAG: hypothetical protein ABIJ15_00715 [bacterium]
MIVPLKDFGKSVKELSRNPLGIIALFIVLVYGFTCLLFGFSAKSLTPSERVPLIWFTTLFPCLVLVVFFRLVTRHNRKLYAPKDFRDDESFFGAIRKNQTNPSEAKESDADIKDLMEYGEGFQIIKKLEEKIKEDLRVRKVSNSDKKAEVLIHQLAAAQVLTWFEKTYYMLFGSQIALLKSLNETPSGLTKHFISYRFFETVRNQYPKAFLSWSVDNYLNFLITSNLILPENDKLVITVVGREFLTWLTKSGYSEFKEY